MCVRRMDTVALHRRRSNDSFCKSSGTRWPSTLRHHCTNKWLRITLRDVAHYYLASNNTSTAPLLSRCIKVRNTTLMLGSASHGIREKMNLALLQQLRAWVQQELIEYKKVAVSLKEVISPPVFVKRLVQTSSRTYGATHAGIENTGPLPKY